MQYQVTKSALETCAVQGDVYEKTIRGVAATLRALRYFGAMDGVVDGDTGSRKAHRDSMECLEFLTDALTAVEQRFADEESLGYALELMAKTIPDEQRAAA